MLTKNRENHPKYVFNAENWHNKSKNQLSPVPKLLHVWNVYLYEWLKFMINVGKYSSPIRRIWGMKIDSKLCGSDSNPPKVSLEIPLAATFFSQEMA